MEEAASLFGPADSTSDPFGSIVGNVNDDLAESTTLPSSEPPLSETRDVDAGSTWFNGTSNHYQAEGSLHSAYSWQSSDDAGGHYNSQPRYGASTPSNLGYSQQLNLQESDNLQHMASHDAGHVYQAPQYYQQIAEQPSFEQSSVLQPSDGLPNESTPSALHVHAAHAQPSFDPYRPTTLQASNGDNSHMYPNPSFPSSHDHTTPYSAYQPVANNSLSVPQPGYQAYSAPPRQLTPQVANTSSSIQDNPPDPSQAAALYRPKTTNAYDPPIPPPKPSRQIIGSSGSSRVSSHTGVTQTFAAVQEARHATYQTNASSLPPPGRYTPQAYAPAAAPSAQPVANVSPPRREPHSRTVPGRSVPAETSIGRSPYSVPLAPDSVYSHRDASGHTYAGVESNKLGYHDHETRPGQRTELTARDHSQVSSSGDGFAITNNGYAAAAPIHTNSYEPPKYTPTSERTKSPSSSSVRSARSSRSRNLVSPPPSVGPASRAPVSAGASTESGSAVSRVSSPASTRSWTSPHVPSSDIHAPARSVEPFTSTARDRSMSNSSLVSSHSSLASDPYAPSRHTQNLSEASMSASVHPPARVPVHDADRSQGQTLLMPLQTHAPYAPSPSLLGANDPLGRTSSRAPVVSFGFGGKLVLCFHGSNTLNTGFDIALSSRQTTGIQMRPLHAAIPESAVDHISASFPGPLFCDPGPPTSLVRSAVATQSKNNKAKVVEYLEGRAEEISRGLGYLSQGSPERRQAEGKHILVRLLKVLLENDGHLSGSPQVEAAVRAVLIPGLGDASTVEQSTTSPKTGLYGLDSAAASSLALSAPDPHDRVVSAQTVRSSALDKIQDLLARGDRKAAYCYASDERLWAHAMIIASSIDKEAWKEVVNEFIRSELNSQVLANGTGPGHRDSSALATGREPLKVAYSLYSGQGAASIQALVPPTSLLPKPGEMVQIPALLHSTPISPNFPPHGATTPIPVDVLRKWPETAAMLIPGPSASESSAALLALGDCLLANHWVEAAHACFILAPQSTALGTIGSPGRVSLVGSRGPTAIPNFHVNDDAIVLSEIVEFALSLAPQSKGQEPFGGLPHLQAYKLVRAANLAEMGHMLAASRYCEAITACLSRTHTMPHPELSEQLREFAHRLVGAPHFDKTGSWIRGKMARPSLDTFGNWLGGRLTEFVAGGDDSHTPNGDTTPHENGTFTGPFSHYSTISSSTPSSAPSPQPTVVNNNVLVDAQNKLPLRTGSAQAVRMNSQVQIDRSSSAMEYRPAFRNSSPVPHTVSASAAMSQFPRASSNYSGYPRASLTNNAHQRPENEPSDVGYRAPWWDSSSPDDSSTTTPTVSMFSNGGSSPPSGFVSLMDAPPSRAAPTSNVHTRSSTLTTHDEDDDDDLGLANSSGRPKASLNDSGTSDTPTSDTKAEKADALSKESKPTQQPSGWFSRWWSKEGSKGPVKATLGEESSFVYDKELKRWVNKKGGAEAAQPGAPPPPPSRAQTASPGRSVPRSSTGALPPPPARAASAIDLTASPPKRTVSRSRSNLVPIEGEGPTRGLLSPALPSTDSPPPASTGSPTPPPSRPRSQATKRNLRSRYVDVLQQPTVEI